MLFWRYHVERMLHLLISVLKVSCWEELWLKLLKVSHSKESLKVSHSKESCLSSVFEVSRCEERCIGGVWMSLVGCKFRKSHNCLWQFLACSSMAPSHKRKRKALPKCPCPCCSAVLSEKTIERHLEGTYLPTHIKVACAAAAPHKRPCSEKTHISTSSSDLSSDLSSDSSDISSDSTVDDFGPSGRSEAGKVELELETFNNAQTGSDPRNVNGTWAGSLDLLLDPTTSRKLYRIPGPDVMNLTLNLRISMKMLIAGTRVRMWIRNSNHQKWEHTMV